MIRSSTGLARLPLPRLATSLGVVALLAVAGACRIEPVQQPPPGATAGQGGDDAAPDVTRDLRAEAPPVDQTPGEPPPPRVPNGEACTSNAGCASDICVEGVCCNESCTATCSSCKLPGLVGICVSAPAGEDPKNDCPAEPPASCGRAGGCDGMGRCRLYAVGTECSPLTCTNGMETAPGHCRGPGVCVPGATRSCAPFECGAGRCITACSLVNPCSAGFTCMAGRCMAGGPTLHWRFDEESGTMAMDAAGGNHVGTYVGEPTLPDPSTMVPATMFANPRSRAFGTSGRPGVRLANAPTTLKPGNDFTITLWYRATAVPAMGGDVFNLGTDVLFRIKPMDIEFAKRVSTTAGMVYAVNRVSALTTHLDGKWHHLAGTASATGTALYIDGQSRAATTRGEPTIYTGKDLWVGREAATGHDFSGNIDDVRIYTRVLTAEEITAIAQGKM